MPVSNVMQDRLTRAVDGFIPWASSRGFEGLDRRALRQYWVEYTAGALGQRPDLAGVGFGTVLYYLRRRGVLRGRSFRRGGSSEASEDAAPAASGTAGPGSGWASLFPAAERLAVRLACVASAPLENDGPAPAIFVVPGQRVFVLGEAGEGWLCVVNTALRERGYLPQGCLRPAMAHLPIGCSAFRWAIVEVAFAPSMCGYPADTSMPVDPGQCLIVSGEMLAGWGFAQNVDTDECGYVPWGCLRWLTPSDFIGPGRSARGGSGP
mmetsp:Transcript_54453/g.124912  ORF Transcript_54453/g.124912 Transcript_54453/m.124912 type:complete len:265 (-) Transcript_54453:494-1288(-)|eukprot:CAMPEP_0204342198 /NCGR_PEP_ID=MMETSP0469-20131031/23964_1 /ASSEMBLY_ACC=CAM_ASM_000384 /TAXON_ID=2969 /ORGANISM="Oxyrrhis marina" /LENGTH=264 /DNA_ID=CAMNT_0051327061 /DNA_START=26 /DNA_END=820 /DNA_ORIENTATION=+